jgi:hypothetical protein
MKETNNEIRIRTLGNELDNLTACTLQYPLLTMQTYTLGPAILKIKIPLEEFASSHGIAISNTSNSHSHPTRFHVLSTSASADGNSLADARDATSDRATGDECIGSLQRKRKVLSESQAAAIFLAGIHAADSGGYQRGLATMLAREYQVPMTVPLKFSRSLQASSWNAVDPLISNGPSFPSSTSLAPYTSFDPRP